MLNCWHVFNLKPPDHMQLPHGVKVLDGFKHDTTDQS